MLSVPILTVSLEWPLWGVGPSGLQCLGGLIILAGLAVLIQIESRQGPPDNQPAPRGQSSRIARIALSRYRDRQSILPRGFVPRQLKGQDSMSQELQPTARWYAGVTRYQWLVLVIACLGWIFDVFEGQIFAVYKSDALADVLEVAASDPIVDWYSNVGFASFLIGGAVGGLFFGVLADRIGRRQTMVWSILTYSAFTGLHYFADTWWHIVGLRFFVAMGVAGEWAIAASLVSEVFPKKARAFAGGIFHASSVLGAVMASIVGMFLTADTDWRFAFLVGVLPAILVVWVLVSLKESEKWQSASAAGTEDGKKKGRKSDGAVRCSPVAKSGILRAGPGLDRLGHLLGNICMGTRTSPRNPRRQRLRRGSPRESIVRLSNHELHRRTCRTAGLRAHYHSH